MDTIELIKELKIIIQKLTNDLEQSFEKEKLLKDALDLTFPYLLYKQLRPDVLKVLGNEKQALVNHYLKYGIKNNVPIQENLDNLLMPDEGQSIACSYSRDIFELEKLVQIQANRDSGLKFSKTSGTKICIDSNERHEFARKFSLVHLQSNSICTWIPKNSCSSLRYSIAIANGAISNLNDISWIHQNNKSFCASNKELLTAKYSFVILRNPFKRLLSFYFDKICHNDNLQQDKSQELAHKVFNTTDTTSFKDFVNTISKSPWLINEDIHTKKQCDFLIYTQYDDYFSLENYKDTPEHIHKKIGLELFDTRDTNSIFTTKGMKESDKFTPNSTAAENRKLFNDNIKPIPESMYTLDMLNKVADIYFADILLYMRTIKNGWIELDPWIKRLREI